jgi:1,4-dihydroxy-2-naphthoate octaprenyltransferase
MESAGFKSPAADPSQDRSSPLMGSKVWWLAIRPRTLSISVVPVLAGAALAWREAAALAILPTLAALLGAVLIQIGTNLYNDVADFQRGGDRPERVGPPRVTAMGWASPDQVRLASFIAFGMAALAGLYLIAVGGWPILALGMASILSGLAYSGGPKPIAATPFGEVMVMLFFGLGAVGGTYFLAAGAISPAVLLLGLAIGSLACAALHVNNVRDREPDRLAGRRTLAILAGQERSKLLYALFVLAPLALVLVMPLIVQGRAMTWLEMAPLILYPIPALQAIKAFQRAAPGVAFNGLLARTAKLQMILGALIILSLVP